MGKEYICYKDSQDDKLYIGATVTDVRYKEDVKAEIKRVDGRLYIVPRGGLEKIPLDKEIAKYLKIISDKE